MSVAAIHNDIAVTRFFEAGRMSLEMLSGNGPTFADLLAASELGEATTGLSIGSVASSSGAHPRTETHRSVSMLGHFLTTIVTFSDGTTDVQTVAVDDGQGHMAGFMVSGDWTKRGVAFKANSDLEPEVDLKRPSQDAFSKWKGRLRLAARSTAIGNERLPDRLGEKTAQIDPADVGNLVDLLG